jgi:hypothetical protein
LTRGRIISALAAISVASLFLLCGPAEAAKHRSHHSHHHQYAAHAIKRHATEARVATGGFNFFSPLPTESTAHATRHSRDSRPSRWCGWEMRQLVSVDPGPAFNLAINWRNWGRPAFGPAPGVIGVAAHHVIKVIAVTGPGKVLAISGNDGHAVRTRERSTRGIIAWRQE